MSIQEIYSWQKKTQFELQIEELEEVLQYKFEQNKPSSYPELTNQLISILKYWKEYLGPNEQQRKELETFLGINSNLTGKELIQQLIIEAQKWKTETQASKPTRIKVVSMELEPTMIYLQSFPLQMTQPWLLTEAQYNQVFNNLKEYCTQELLKILSSIKKPQLLEMQEVIKQTWSQFMTNAQSAIKQDIPNEPVHYQSVHNVEKKDTLERTAHSSHV